MTDDEELIARLRSKIIIHTDAAVWMLEAADRIEALTAKLGKAVEALEDIVKDCEADYPPSHGAIKYFARAALAEIKGESHD
ncbi:hypothetical protein UFOVP845_50 [uncultured Caudovirales phage]|uniref:Uncharacterized protein n=1 Tax=uncultured Caudovirales phage TaxID=2100421 RepID=A0A6J5P6Q1_9CAUD|nr:hypothetical protein UFOVP845_50 [uncultured Caudovirales phage]